MTVLPGDTLKGLDVRHYRAESLRADLTDFEKKLLALFPECEGQKGDVDIDKLRQVLSSTAIEGNVERYQFTWPA